MPSNKPTPILFLDLDDTVRLGPAHNNGQSVKSPADVEIFEGVLDKLKDYKAKGWRIVGIDNQGGIALGKMEESTNNRIVQETQRLCANLFDGIYTCPHHPDAKGSTPEETLELSQCFCHKPLPGLVFMAIYGLSQQYDEFYRPYNCLFVGDEAEDKLCAGNAGIRYMHSEDWRAGKHEPN